jgi:hypothetical protein
VLELFGPRDVGDMDEPVDAVLDLYERPEIRQVAHLSVDLGADRIAVDHGVPRIVHELLHAEADAFFDRVDAKHLHLDLVALMEHPLRVGAALGPRYLRDVHEALDAGFKLDKNTVIGDRRDPALHPRIDRVHFDDGRPGIGLKLLVAERDLFFFAVELEDLYLNVVARLEHLVRVAEAAPRHIGDVQQAVDTAYVDERAVFGEILDRSLDDVTDVDVGQRLRFLFVDDLVGDDLSGQNDIVTAAAEFDDLRLDVLTDVGIEPADGSRIDLGARQKRLDAVKVDLQTAFGLVDDPTGDRLVVLVGLFDLVPDLARFGVRAR